MSVLCRVHITSVEPAGATVWIEFTIDQLHPDATDLSMIAEGGTADEGFVRRFVARALADAPGENAIIRRLGRERLCADGFEPAFVRRVIRIADESVCLVDAAARDPEEVATFRDRFEVARDLDAFRHLAALQNAGPDERAALVVQHDLDRDLIEADVVAYYAALAEERGYETWRTGLTMRVEVEVSWAEHLHPGLHYESAAFGGQ